MRAANAWMNSLRAACISRNMAMQKATTANRINESRIPGAAIAVLLVTCLFALVWSHFKLFWVDELLEFYSDTRSSFGAVIQGQLRYPFSLEPPAFHLLLHAMNRLLPWHQELASRLPSIASMLVTQVCVFRITRKLLHDSRVALLAMTLPLLFATFDFAAEARVYALLTALFALALAAYQETLERENKRRTAPLIVLFGACTTAVLVHYYGLFLPVPFLVGELVKSIRSRKVDWPVVCTLLAAFLFFACNLPFFAGLSEIRVHYYGGTEAEAGWQMVPITYLWLLGQYNIYENNQYGNVLRFGVFFVAYVVLPAMLIMLAMRQAKQNTRIASPIYAALLAGFFLPVINIFVAHYKTHAYVMRYSVPAVVPLSVLLAWMLKPYLRKTSIFAVATLGFLLMASAQAVHDIQHDRLIRTKGLAAEQVTSDLVHARASTADQHVYMQDVAKFLTTHVYALAAEKPLLIGLQSVDREIFWLHRDPSSLFLRNMHCSTSLPAISLEQLRKETAPHLLVVFDDPKEEWIGLELNDKARVTQVEPMGLAFGGRLLRVTFAPLPDEPVSSSWQCGSGELR